MDDDLSIWLRLREPADAAARSESLTRAIADTIAQTIGGTTATAAPVRVLDLATGTGANLRYLAPHLPGRQRWLVVDRSAALLALMPALTASWGEPRRYETRTELNGFLIRGDGLECEVETRQLDLGTGFDAGIFAGCHLVTASALLDLVSDRWLRALAAQCRAVGAAALFALTYNGSSSFSPVEPEDETIRDLLNRHQHTDKGLGGPAAGPEAAACAGRAFAEAGFRVRTEPSDWMLGPAESELQRELIEGSAEAAIRMAPDDTSAIAEWRLRRIAHIDAGRSRTSVGHFDVAAWLPRG